ncbi:MAG TPA: GGDEF domain-containing protein, partial [Acidobacteriaceae bacterium]
DFRIDAACRAAARGTQPLSLLMIDVDLFKQLNDESGHLAGDRYLVLIARALQQVLPRTTDLVARFGGEEFAVLLPFTERSGAEAVANRLREAIVDLRLEHPASPIGIVTISVGGVSAEGTTIPSPMALIATADRALYRAKAYGRNRTEFLPLDVESAP